MVLTSGGDLCPRNAARRVGRGGSMTEADDGRTRVLVVDDHDLVAETLRRALSLESDLEVVGSAGTVAGAVTSARALQPDVVVMDFRLPDGTGAQATAL